MILFKFKIWISCFYFSLLKDIYFCIIWIYSLDEQRLKCFWEYKIRLSKLLLTKYTIYLSELKKNVFKSCLLFSSLKYFQPETDYCEYSENEKEFSKVVSDSSNQQSLDSIHQHTEECELAKHFRGFEPRGPISQPEESKSEIDKITRYFEILEFLEKDLKTGKRYRD